LFNKAYYDHLSRFKPGRLDEADLNAGYYNQGRNLLVGLYLPFVFKYSKSSFSELFWLES